MRSLRFRLVLAHTAIFAVAIALLAGVAWRLMGTYRFAELDRQLEERDAGLRGYLLIEKGKPVWDYDLNDDEQMSFLLRAARYYQIYDSSGNLLETSREADLLDLKFTDAAREALAQRTTTWETLRLPSPEQPGQSVGLRVLNSLLYTAHGTYLLRVGTSFDAVQRAQRQFGLLLLIVVPLVILAGGVTAWWMAGQAFGRVTQIASVAEQISASDLARRLPLAGTQDEIDQLSERLNRMIARLENSFVEMRQFLLNISHELRTPLSALRAECEIALRVAGSEDEYRAALASNIQELDRMTRTITNLLALAQAEAGQTLLHRTPEDLSRLAADAVDAVRPLAAERGVELAGPALGSAFGAVELTADVDPEQILRLLWNLLENAVKFNRPGGRVTVTVSPVRVAPLLADFSGGRGRRAISSAASRNSAVGDWVVVEVSDTGRGISPADLPRVFDRFFRSRDAQTAATPGTGIGLSLAKWIAEAHGGHIEAESRLGIGASFRAWLPRSTQPAAATPGAGAAASQGASLLPASPTGAISEPVEVLRASSGQQEND